jgi:membrane dipeptidase
MIIIDSHLDLAMNALLWNRDLTQGVYYTRQQESGMCEKGRGRGTVALPEMRTGEVAVCCATLIARLSRPGNPRPGYSSPEIACAVAQGQLAYYRLLEERGEVRLITDGRGRRRTNCPRASFWPWRERTQFSRPSRWRGGGGKGSGW